MEHEVTQNAKLTNKSGLGHNMFGDLLSRIINSYCTTSKCADFHSTPAPPLNSDESVLALTEWVHYAKNQLQMHFRRKDAYLFMGEGAAFKPQKNSFINRKALASVLLDLVVNLRVM